ncbi:hypothetical protein GQ457_03G009910 [Hibiscus cannabinus]
MGKGLNVATSSYPPAFLKLLSQPPPRKEKKHGGLGAGGAVCVVKSRIAVSVAREEQSGGVWEHADQWDLHSRPYCNLLWCPHLHWIGFVFLLFLVFL